MEKLVRDRIIEFSEEKQDGRVFRTADPSEMNDLLCNKLLEEAHEVIEAAKANGFSNLAEELADLREVMGALQNLHHISEDFVQRKRAEKAQRKGTFLCRLVLKIDTNPPEFQK